MLALTLRFGLVFGSPALVLAICAHVFLPSRTKTLLALLLVIEIVAVLALFYYELRRQQTGMEILPLPGVLIGIVVANLIAIPIARWMRSLFR